MVGGDGGTKGDKVGVLSRLQYFTTPYNRDITGGELGGSIELELSQSNICMLNKTFVNISCSDLVDHLAIIWFCFLKYFPLLSPVSVSDMKQVCNMR